VRFAPLPCSPAGTYDLRICCNGVLSGLVTVTCMCGFVDPWAAVVCSGIAGAMYTGMSSLLLRCGIDDPLDSSAVHLGNGLLGTLMLAFVAKPEHVLALTGSPCGGVFYSSTGWLQLGLQLMGEWCSRWRCSAQTAAISQHMPAYMQ
jgi:Amt family ammonium transporter